MEAVYIDHIDECDLSKDIKRIWEAFKKWAQGFTHTFGTLCFLLVLAAVPVGKHLPIYVYSIHI